MRPLNHGRRFERYLSSTMRSALTFLTCIGALIVVVACSSESLSEHEKLIRDQVRLMEQLAEECDVNPKSEEARRLATELELIAFEMADLAPPSPSLEKELGEKYGEKIAELIPRCREAMIHGGQMGTHEGGVIRELTGGGLKDALDAMPRGNQEGED